MVFMRKNAIVWPTYIENLVDLLMLIAEDKRAMSVTAIWYTMANIQHWKNLPIALAKSINAKEVKMRIPYWLAYSVAVVMEFFGKLVESKR
jgi:hypothetical protein